MKLLNDGDINKVIAKNLRSLRTSFNLSQSEVGKILGISFQQIQRYENAQNRISAEYVYKLSEFFGVTIDNFYQSISIELDVEALEIMKVIKEMKNTDKRREALELIKSFSAKNVAVIEGSVEVIGTEFSNNNIN